MRPASAWQVAIAALAIAVALRARADDAPSWEGDFAWRTGLVEPARLLSITPDGEARLAWHGPGERTVVRIVDGLRYARVPGGALQRARRELVARGLPAGGVGLHLLDHTFVVGEADIDAGRARVSSAVLGAVDVPVGAVAGWGAPVPVRFRGVPTIHAGVAPEEFARMVRLGGGLLVGERADGAGFARPLAGVHLVALAAPADRASVAITLDLACGSRLRGIRLAFDGQRFSLDTRWLGRVTVSAAAVVGFALGPATFEEGLLVVCEYEGGSVLRRNLLTGETWRKDGLNYPNACFRFAPDRWLVSNSRSDELVWMDVAGNELGKIGGFSNTWSIERDGDGNLLVVSSNDQRIVLLTPEGKVLHEWKTEKSALRAKPLANGNILVAMTYDEALVELDRAGRKVWEWKCGARPVDVELLANGNYLACLESIGKVVEVTREGRIVWEFSRGLKNPYDVDRLPNGNTLIVDRGAGRVIEVSPTGEIVWELAGLKGPVDVERY